MHRSLYLCFLEHLPDLGQSMSKILPLRQSVNWFTWALMLKSAYFNLGIGILCVWSDWPQTLGVRFIWFPLLSQPLVLPHTSPSSLSSFSYHITAKHFASLLGPNAHQRKELQSNRMRWKVLRACQEDTSRMSDMQQLYCEACLNKSMNSHHFLPQKMK